MGTRKNRLNEAVLRGIVGTRKNRLDEVVLPGTQNEAVLTRTHNLYLEQKNKKYQTFFI